MNTTLESSVSQESTNSRQLITKLLAAIAALLAILVVINIYSTIKEQRHQADLLLATITLQQNVERVANSVEVLDELDGTLERVAVGVEAAESRAVLRDLKLKALGRLATDQDELISGLLYSYQQDAYDNPSLDRITEQQLIAAEYQLTAMQLLALQNSEIIQLLAVTP